MKYAYLCLIALLLLIATGLKGLRIGTLASPGPGQWPAILLALSLVLAIILIFTDKTAVEIGERDQYVRVGIALLALIAFVPMYYYLGFPIAASAIGFVYLSVLGGEKLWVSAIGAVVNALAIYFIFSTLLGVPI